MNTSFLRGTYICEQTFSYTKRTKNKIRAKILDESLETILNELISKKKNKHSQCSREKFPHFFHQYKYIFLINVSFHCKSYFNILLKNVGYIKLIKKKKKNIYRQIFVGQ